MTTQGPRASSKTTFFGAKTREERRVNGRDIGNLPQMYYIVCVCVG